MKQLKTEQRARILHCLVECMSIRATARLNDVAINTVVKLVIDLGRACEAYQSAVFQNLDIKTVECDEIWAFVGTKEERKMEHQPAGWGSVYAWTAIDPKSRLMPCWHIGGRAASDAYTFVQKLRWAIKNEAKDLQIVSDGNITYLPAISEIFGTDVNYMQYHKVFYNEHEIQEYRRYSMPRMKASKRHVMIGKPDAALSTNFIESSNKTIRCLSRRYVRMTNAFSKKLENHRLSFATTMMHYNFCRIHSSIRCTPAMEAGLTDRIWTHEDVVRLLDPVANASAA